MEPIFDVPLVGAALLALKFIRLIAAELQHALVRGSRRFLGE